MDILVYADWSGLNGPQQLGTLSVARTKGRGVFSFAYAKTWIDAGFAQQLDPDLQLYTGAQYLTGEKPNFGAFLDSSPDRWGRVLMERREALMARKADHKPRTFFEEDYLLGVFDRHRMGALRFKTEIDGPFLHADSTMASPPFTSLRELENASLQLENDAQNDDKALKWINMLLSPGASLGGARPKASVQDPEGKLWIAKFPSIADKTNIGGWEMVANMIGQEAGININVGNVKSFNSSHYTYLTKRFDRAGQDRLHFASAMTLLGKLDGEPASYLELAEFIIRHGSQPDSDLQELWTRIVFYIAIKNTDDHLRNHGFMLTNKGWHLSPAFDINPVYFGKGLTLNISEMDNALDVDLALSVTKYFRVELEAGKKIIERVNNAVSKWRDHATALKIPRSEQELMAQAFE